MQFSYTWRLPEPSGSPKESLEDGRSGPERGAITKGTFVSKRSVESPQSLNFLAVSLVSGLAILSSCYNSRPELKTPQTTEIAVFGGN